MRDARTVAPDGALSGRGTTAVRSHAGGETPRQRRNDMLTRREWLGGGVAGATLGAEQRSDFTDDQARRITVSLERLAAEAAAANRGCDTGTCASTAKLRELYTPWLRASQKFPDFVDVGVQVFYEVYDWHVRNVQPLTLTRLPDGRYTLGFMFTRLVLRPDVVPDFIGQPYDARA
jgi:hypothetical protein